MLLGFLSATVVCVSILCLSLSRECWATVKLNCYRLDGSFSRRRFGREGRAFLDYAATIAVPLLLAFLTIFVVATLVFTYVIPLPMIFDSFVAFDPDPEEWRGNLSEVKQEHAFHLQKTGADAETIQGIQSSMWHDWPIWAAVAVGFLVLSLVSLFKCAARAVEFLASGIRQRRRMYAQGDVLNMKLPTEEIAV